MRIDICFNKFIKIDFVQIYEGRSIVCLQMSDTTAALKDINHAIKLKRSAEFYVNRGVIYQVNKKKIFMFFNNFKIFNLFLVYG